MKKIQRIRRGLTFVEVMIAMIIALPITATLISTFVYVLRMQATCADQTRTRIMAEMAVNRMVEDVRNTSAQAYRNLIWPKVSGRALTDKTLKLTLLDSAMGNRIVWDYDRTTRQLTRTVDNLNDLNAPAIRTYIGKFADMDFEEKGHKTENCTYGVLAAASTYEVDEFDEETSSTVKRVYEVPAAYQQLSCTEETTTNGIAIRGRSFLSISPRNSAWKEIDKDGDGDYRSDAFGKTMFKRQNLGDDPVWQHIFNIEVSFRNT